MQEKGKSRTALWVLLALGAVALLVFLYGGFGGPDAAIEDENGLDARETVDEVIFLEDENASQRNADGGASQGQPPVE